MVIARIARFVGRVACPMLAIAAARAASCPAGIGAAPGPVPPPLVAEYLKTFNVPASYADHTGLVRCASGRVLACSLGANLPCGKADTRTANPGATAWCAQHSDAPFVPAYAAGHATLYAWRCDGAHARIDRQIAHADTQGYVAEYWQPLR